ncbi:MAG TPA: Holliday junction resolvase RuvX [Candidatus Solibacter sp.]|jgi:putative Holliday junction resolvase|nr:Holliday junction resolvase RuvX [Candidatus Solibacter sp.]
MRVLAVDPGRVRVGLALSDEGARLATPHSTLPGGAGLATRIVEVAEDAGAGTIVVGLPRRLDGTEGLEAEAARALAAEISATSGLAVELWDERFTSSMAEAALKISRPRRGAKVAGARREAADRVAAAVLLQSYLDRRQAAPEKAAPQ